ncbi:MAG: PIN domain-containing protein [Bacteroidia bacterium]
MNNILLDTNILIYLLQGNASLKEILEDKTWFISFITEMEIQMKPDLSNSELKAIRSLLDECIIMEMNNLIKSKAINSAINFKLKLADSIIFATAQIQNMPLITADSVFKKIAEQKNDVLFIIP